MELIKKDIACQKKCPFNLPNNCITDKCIAWIHIPLVKDCLNNNQTEDFGICSRLN